MSPSARAPRAALAPGGEELAKEWLVRIIEQTPLEELGSLPVARIAAEGPELIAELLGAVAGADAAGLEEAGRTRARSLAQLREGASAPERIPVDLAALQALMVESLRREIPDRDRADFARAVERLALLFGSIQAGVTSALVEEGRAGAADPLTGLPGPAELEEALRIAHAEYRRYGHPFAIAVVELDGIDRVNDAYGTAAADRMLAAVAAVIRRYVRAVDQPFRLGGGEFCVLASHQRAGGLVPAAERVAAMVESAQPEEGPLLGVAVGIGCCPDDGEAVDEIREAADQALFAAKAAGRPVVVGRNGSATDLQDR